MTRAAASGTRKRADREAALRLARKTFNAQQRVEVNDLAAALGVNRVTIYRWLGDRDAVLAEVIWRLGEQTVHQAYAAVGGIGGRRIANTMSTFVRHTLAHAGMRHFLTNETETALRVLTRGEQTFQPRLVALVEDLLTREHEAGALTTGDLGLHDLAYLCVRVGESFVYTDAITGETPDPDRAERALHYLLR
ncbi:QsdR family transcriptional regulator [Amycolatopsis jiangsuensis]|uniref:AcrR family transcriptional regulator n=1 Tax=Amycolatopsis jiangsuensis TaxID=1181879 RepID=A0A840IUJ0_9PSEU|nr:QsdR family transcriptional regulator [Amycolatopsis jiangsuensis]MBB4684882.1 AcrR family transcriptional regulator [Amycolatopsis jiangsuensis]